MKLLLNIREIFLNQCNFLNLKSMILNNFYNKNPNYNYNKVN